MSSGNPVVIALPDLPCELDAGVRSPLTIALNLPADQPQSVVIRQIRSNSANVEIIADTFFGDIELIPGESLRVPVELFARRPGIVSMQDLAVQVDGELYPLGQQTVIVRPSLRKEIDVSVEPICTYEQGTKVLVNVAHLGRTAFQDVRLCLSPAGAVRLGKTDVRRKALVPGQQEQLEVIAAPGELGIEISGSADGHQARSAWSALVPVAPPRPPERRFRFLEPRGLARDAVTVFALHDDVPREVLSREGVYPVCGRERYRIVIRPDAGKRVSDIRLRELPEQVHVNQSAKQVVAGRWEFEVFIAANTLLTRRARLFYDMETPTGPLTGELHLTLLPSPWRHLRLAATLGVAITVQSLTALFGALLGNDPQWGTELARFHPFSGSGRFWALFSIPIAWGGLQLIDRLQYRWRS
jgi:hypothetical protein